MSYHVNKSSEEQLGISITHVRKYKQATRSTVGHRKSKTKGRNAKPTATKIRSLEKAMQPHHYE